MRKNTIILSSSLFLLAGCQFTVGQAILTSVGSKNTSSTVEGHIVSANSEHKTTKESVEPASNSIAVPSSPTNNPTPTVTPSPGPSSTVIIATNPTPSPSVTPTVSPSPVKE